MFKLICRKMSLTPYGDDGLLVRLKMNRWAAKWNIANRDTLNKRMFIEIIDNDAVAYLTFDNEEDATIFKLSHYESVLQNR